ncbi:hypothetical protein LDG_7446 [Legionella drancourtii LLAP12]|uniref:Uncharacterized protein n=1 Tax=Legionella drancourtii LLAP12 TaxID=658187 RepID=G9EQ99_9GAMM|nr:hypothetical protein LDG_7446 [Legionella drancourtii LLAP12]
MQGKALIKKGQHAGHVVIVQSLKVADLLVLKIQVSLRFPTKRSATVIGELG